MFCGFKIKKKDLKLEFQVSSSFREFDDECWLREVNDIFYKCLQ